jgi:hypothetical protein
MSYNLTDLNVQVQQQDPIMVIDELSTIEYYVGVSKNSHDYNKPDWKIKRIWKIGSVWKFGYPDGDQSFNFIWDNRLVYIYK